MFLLLNLLASFSTARIDDASQGAPALASTPDAVERFAPHPVYDRLSPQAEALLGDQKIPSNPTPAQWAADLDTLYDLILQRVPYAAAAYGHDLDKRLARLKRGLAEQNRDQRAMALFRLLNAPESGTGHFRIRPMQRALGWRALPIRLYRFADGVFVIAALNEELVGREVVAINETRIDDVYARLAPYISADNRFHRLRRTEEQMLRWINPLHATGIADSLDSVSLTTRSASGQKSETTVPSISPTSPDWQRYMDSIPALGADETWSPVAEYLDNDEPFYRLRHEKQDQLLYLQFNTVLNESDFDAFSDRSIEDLAREMRGIVDSHPIEKVVVDLRTNTGGDFTLVEPLIELLSQHPKIDRRDALYTLISPVTFSAAGVFAGILERRTKTLFVGEPGGFAPTQWGEVVPALLPESKIAVHLSYAFYAFDLPDMQRDHIQPDLHVPLTSEQYFSNHDLALAAIREHEPRLEPTEPLRASAAHSLTGSYRLSPIHRLTIEPEASGLELRVTGQSYYPDLSSSEPEIFVSTRLYSQEANRYATDITGVFLQAEGDDRLSLEWKGRRYPLSAIGETSDTPLAQLKSGRLDAGTDALRRALESGMKLGNDVTEYPFRRRAAALMEKGQASAALRYARAATDLAPLSWRSHADLAGILRALDRPDAARQAQAKADTLNPLLRQQRSGTE